MTKSRMKSFYPYFILLTLGLQAGCQFALPADKILQECIVPDEILIETDAKNPRKFLCSLNKPATDIIGNILWTISGSGSAGYAGTTSAVEFISVGVGKIYVDFKTACGKEVTLVKEVNVPTVVDIWNQLNSYPGQGRTQMIACYAGGNLIVGMGKKNETESAKDIWVFDYSGKWRRLADYPGIAEFGAFAFSVNGLTVGMGKAIGSATLANDVWQFDQSRNVWVKKKDFPIKTSGLMTYCSVFAGNGQDKGYVITNEKELYEYDGVLDAWTKKNSFPGEWRTQCVTFPIGQKIYLGTGNTPVSNNYYEDFWEYDPGRDSWTRKANFPGGKRRSAFGFGYGGKGYVGEGVNDGSSNGGEIIAGDFWQYSPDTDTWMKKSNYGSGSINALGAASACFGGKCFVFCGLNNASVWEYIP